MDHAERVLDGANQLIGLERPAAVAHLLGLSTGKRPKILRKVVLCRHPGPAQPHGNDVRLAR
jgi:hypothetical protein